MRKQRWISALLALALLACLLPTAVLAAGEVTYTLQAGKNYKITNSDLDKSFSLSNDSGSSRTYDHVNYNQKGTVYLHGQNSTGSFYVRPGGYTVISVNERDIATTITEAQRNAISVAEIGEPALVTYTLQAGKNYKLLNSDLDNTYSIINNSGSNRTYDYVDYNQKGTVYLHGQNGTGSFYVRPGGYTVISVNEREISGYMPYTRKDTLVFEEISEPALAIYTLQAGKNYKLLNSDLDNTYSIINNSGSNRTYDYVDYNQKGTVYLHGQNGTGSFYVRPGGYTVISVNEREIAGYVPYTKCNILQFYETGDPALIDFTLQAGTNYKLSNSDLGNAYSIINNSSKSRTYDYVDYNQKGTVYIQGQNGTGSFYVRPGGYTDLTINEREIETYMPYSYYGTALTFTDASGRVLPKPSYPAVNIPVPYQAGLTDGSGSVDLSGNVTDGGGTVEYIYNTTDVGESVVLPVEKLDTVTDSSTAASAVRDMTSGMTQEQKSAATGADLATLYAETAVSKAASKAVSGTDILINKAAIAELETIAKQTSAAVESALVSGGVSTARYISNIVTLSTEETGEISIRIDPDILTTEVDKVVVEAPTYAITLKVADLKEDLTQILTITVQDVGSGFAPGSSNAKATVKVNLPNGKTSNSVTLSLPKASGDTTYQTVVNTSGTATSSKYNPATTAIDGKVNTSGNYTVQTNQADFTDISNKSAEMQKAIRYLAARGIIGGTGGTNYSPDESITRAQIAALVIRALGKVDEGAKPTFKDVTTNNWYYSTAAVSQKAGIINGYEDNTYKGDNQILKEQIVAVAARVLKNEMGYKEPSNMSSYLSKYSDSVAGWAQPEVALATRENIVVYRTDGTFSGSKGMTRGDAAIIIYRLFQRIW